MATSISAHTAADLLAEGKEIALLDIREPGPFSEGHPLFAVSCPWSRLEAEILDLVPRLSVPVILIDGGDRVASLAARALERLGYTDVLVLDGGILGWASSGLTLFKGVHVPSKALGELAEEVMHPRSLSPDDFAGWQSAGRDFAFYDTRPASEHRKMTVPGATCLPNGELPHRLAQVPKDVPIVVTCAGRTRGIIGAVSINLVVPERNVFWLEDGTQGWFLSGRDLQAENAIPTFDRVGGDDAATTRQRAEDFVARHDLEVVSQNSIREMCADLFKTTYLFDVRSPDEAGADPLPGFIQSPVVELIQATDRFIGVRNARVVLADDLGLRAALAAFWLRTMGYQVFVSLIEHEAGTLQPDRPRAHKVPLLPRISAPDALAAQASGKAILVDLRLSTDYAAGHAAGSIWSIRPRLSEIPDSPQKVLLVGDQAPFADLAGQTLLDSGRAEVFVVDGGFPALVAAGAVVSACDRMEPAIACDLTSFAQGRHEGNKFASRLYLSWEKGLLAQLSGRERAAFRL